MNGPAGEVGYPRLLLSHADQSGKGGPPADAIYYPPDGARRLPSVNHPFDGS
jgi:hypothetical protein